MAGKVFTHKFFVREWMIDTYGHLNNVNYFGVMEEARWQMSTESGLGWDRVREVGKGPIILSIDIQFRKEIKLREEVTIFTQFDRFEGKIGYLNQTFRKTNGQRAAMANLRMAVFDIRERKMVDPSPEWLHELGLA